MVPRHFEARLPPLRLLVKAESHTQELGVRVKLKQPSPALNLMSSNRGKRSTRISSLRRLSTVLLTDWRPYDNGSQTDCWGNKNLVIPIVNVIFVDEAARIIILFSLPTLFCYLLFSFLKVIFSQKSKIRRIRSPWFLVLRSLLDLKTAAESELKPGEIEDRDR